LRVDVQPLGALVRQHWALGMVFRDDKCLVRTASAAANFTTLKHMVRGAALAATRPGQALHPRPPKGRCMG